MVTLGLSPQTEWSHTSFNDNEWDAVVDKLNFESARIISRPWAADSDIKDCVDRLARGKGSPARLVQNSPELKRLLENIIAGDSEQIIGKRATNLRAAKHRFESFSKPLARSMLWIEKIVPMMVRVSPGPS